MPFCLRPNILKSFGSGEKEANIRHEPKLWFGRVDSALGEKRAKKLKVEERMELKE